MQLNMQLLQADFGKRKGHLSHLAFILHITKVGCSGLFRGVFVRVLVCLKPVLPFPLGSLRQPDCFPNFQLG
jgi:hypothetical protein